MARVLVIRHHWEDHPGLIGEALATRGYQLDVVMMDETTSTPSLDGYDVLVILGSKNAVYDKEVEAAWFGKELELIGDAEARGLAILGICFGAQALCVFHGGEVIPSDFPEIGWFEVEAVNDSAIASGPWFEYHFDRCVLPVGAQLWAKSARAVQAFAVGNHVGVQFHPEVDELQLRDWLAVGGDEARASGVDVEALLAETRRETSAARIRAGNLVDLFLAHITR
jgi:GMP synthase-like glutamine amidotransferase